MNDQTSKYFDATQYAYAVLGGDASRYFPRLHRLSRYNSPEELRAIVDGWRPAAPPPPPAPDSWQPGATWGSAGAVRVARDRGIIWKIRCPCGQLFEVSCNDTVPENRRKCPNCIRADELSDARRVLVFKLEAIAQTVLVWYRDHGKLVWDRVWKACHRRGINDQNFAKELNALGSCR